MPGWRVFCLFYILPCSVGLTVFSDTCREVPESWIIPENPWKIRADSMSRVFQTYLQTSEHTSSTFSCELRVILHVRLKKIHPRAVGSLMHEQTRRCPRPDAGAGEDLLHRSSKNITTLPSWWEKKKKPQKNCWPIRGRLGGVHQETAMSPVARRHGRLEQGERERACRAERGWKVIQHRYDLSSSH